jgi:benzaldehyde dehydrogenase (NAD)
MSKVNFGTLLGDQRWKGKIFNGQWVSSQAGARDVPEPATGEPFSNVGFANAADIETAAAAAAKAQKSWAAVGARERAALLRAAAGVLERDAEALAVIVARESGGILPKGQHELREAAVILYGAAALAIQPRGDVLANPPGRLSYARRIPRGVIGVISPFNFPLLLSLRAVAPALATGNAVVLKPDPQTPLSGGFMIARAFEEAGLPAGVLHVLPGGADAGEALCLSRHVQMIQFTGSTAVGRRVAELAGRTLKKVSLELGGNNALIILDDADLDLAVNNAAWGAFLHQGQICMASSRMFVQDRIADEFTRRLAERAAHLPVGDPASGQVALGPVINQKQLERVRGIVADSVKAGAKVETGGKTKGLFHEPTVLSGVKPGMRAFDEETFGPVAAVIRARDEAEAIALANDSDYGLYAYVWTRDRARGTRVARALRTGTVQVNSAGGMHPDAPFGGYKRSGIGRDGGAWALAAYSETKYIGWTA